MNKRQSVYLVGAVLVTALALIQWLTLPTFNGLLNQASETEKIANNSAVENPVEDLGVSEQPFADRPQLPSSLSNTHHGVTLRAHNDALIITASLKDLFDYYLTAAGEETLAQITERVEYDLHQQLAQVALVEALGIWTQYLAYKHELVGFDQQFPAHSENKTRLDQLQFLQQRQMALIALQDQILTPQVAEILFAFDRKLDQLTLEKAELLASDLTTEQKQQGLINLQAQLPIDALQGLRRNQQQQSLMLIDEDKTLTAQKKFQLRSEQVGASAASRLQKLDEERARWSQRIIEFKQQKKFLQNSGLADEEYLGSLEKLYTQHFAPSEQLRARALTSRDE